MFKSNTLKKDYKHSKIVKMIGILYSENLEEGFSLTCFRSLVLMYLGKYLSASK